MLVLAAFANSIKKAAGLVLGEQGEKLTRGVHLDTIAFVSSQRTGKSVETLHSRTEGESIMELTEEMLGRIASHIADLRLKFGVIRAILIKMGVNEVELDKILDQDLEGAEFQQARALVLEQLRGEH